MEPKVIIYIIAGVLYFLYSVGKKVQEKQKANLPAPSTGEAPQAKPISPPDYNRDKQKRKLEREVQKNMQREPAKVSRPELVPAKLKQEVSNKSYYEVQAREEAARPKVADVVKASDITQPEAVGDVPYEFDARQAFIGSLIFERKY